MSTVSRNDWLNNRFEQMDADDDGYITESDFVQTVHDAAHAVGRPADGPQARRAEEQIRVTWKAMAKPDTNADGRLSREEYVAAFGQNPDGLVQLLSTASDVSNAFFDLCDLDGDGEITAAEFGKLMAGFKVPADISTTVFSWIDSNDDGRISRAEYTDSWVSIYTTDFLDDPAKGLAGAR